MRDILEVQEQVQEEARQQHVEGSKKISKQMIDMVIFFGKKELAFRLHRESLANDPSFNIEKFLETSKYLANYNDAITTHLEKVEKNYREMEEKNKGSK